MIFSPLDSAIPLFGTKIMKAKIPQSRYAEDKSSQFLQGHRVFCNLSTSCPIHKTCPSTVTLWTDGCLYKRPCASIKFHFGVI